LTLPGSVEAGLVSRVASEVAGLVTEVPVREGERVKKGELLARLSERSLELSLRAAEAQLEEAEARQKLAERNYERARELSASGIFSRQQLDDALYEFRAWQGRIDQLRAEIDRIRYEQERCRIAAPFDGVVVARHTEVGQWLKVGDPVAEVLSLEELEVVVNVPERYYRTIRAGAPARLMLDAFPGAVVRGRVSAVIPRAEPQARTFPVRVRIRDEAGRIAVGMLAQVELDGVFETGEGPRLATIVPKDAVVREGAELRVYVLDGDGVAKAVTVSAGAAVGAWTEVHGPIAPGQKVITRGNERLSPGQKVAGERVDYPLP
jgi:RND family efflux transporter MFP subunit